MHQGVLMSSAQQEQKGERRQEGGVDTRFYLVHLSQHGLWFSALASNIFQSYIHFQLIQDSRTDCGLMLDKGNAWHPLHK